MRIGLVQCNAVVGDLAGNADRMRLWALRAAQAGCDLCVFPELAVCGYPPRDLLLQEGFVRACQEHALGLIGALGAAAETAELTVVIGTPAGHGTSNGGRVGNALIAGRGGAELARYHKRLLPTYDVFDEDRYFVPGDRAVVVGVPCGGGGGPVPVGLSVCEDLWRGEDVGFAGRYLECPDPVGGLIDAGARVIVNPSASPFVVGKAGRHEALLAGHALRHGVTIAAVNQVGGNDELVFDGRAVVVDGRGAVVAAGPAFEEHLVVCDVGAGADAGGAGPAQARGRVVPAPEGRAEWVWRALVLGVRDYARKTGFGSAVLGLSGGIDSAVTCVIAAAALGPDRVLGVSMPGPHSSPGSVSDAQDLAARLGVRLLSVPVVGMYQSALGALAGALAGKPQDTTEENLQSRLRGVVVMALANKHGHLPLTTGNKSELAVGYCTLYGDMNGGLAVISDLTKGDVYQLARWINERWQALGIAGLRGPPVPEASIAKPPSAELRPGQTDQDTLPPYDAVDEVVSAYVERRQGAAQIASESGIDRAVVDRLVAMIDRSEFKRRQAAVGIKVRSVAFGSGRRWPIAQGYRG
ncbi:MAG: NAD+ synthase [Planctomyces sp.]|nr:NAD+ synthase [Planctomyces sp.]MBA4120504.1 NAD+ synthase [Isosphaera sp.]